MSGKRSKQVRKLERQYDALAEFAKGIDRRVIVLELREEYGAKPRKQTMWTRIKSFFK